MGLGRSFFVLLLLSAISTVLYLNFMPYFDVLFWRFEAARDSEGELLTGTIGSRLFGSFLQLLMLVNPFGGLA